MAFRSFHELKAHAPRGRDYRVVVRRGRTGLLVMAPHGGGIEPGTDTLASALAGRHHAFYGFVGLKPHGNASLHLPSHRFDEPAACRMTQAALWILTLHGCRGDDGVICVGGRDREGGRIFQHRLRRAGFRVRRAGRKTLAGRHRANLCNRGRSGRGVQLEIARNLRRAHGRPGERPAPPGRRLLRALSQALEKIQDRTSSARDGALKPGGHHDTTF